MTWLLPDEILEEVLRRLPPHEPAQLVRAALVSRRWCRLVSDAGFRRRFREFHRSPPMLGMLCNFYDFRGCGGGGFYKVDKAQFIPTTAFPSSHTAFPDMRVLDARHGHVLFEKGHNVLLVWDPIKGVVRELRIPRNMRLWTAAVLCSAAGACDHLDYHHGSFFIVYVCFKYIPGTTIVYTYASDSASQSEPVCAPCAVLSCMGSALVGNALYFGNVGGRTALKYDLELCQASLIPLPSLSQSSRPLWSSVLTTTEDGRLGLVTENDSKLYLWSRKDTHEVDAKWEKRVIELKTVFPVDVVISKLYVIGSGVDIIFIRTGDEVYTIDLKTTKVKKVYEGTTHKVIPYMSFYTPALKGSCTGDGPGAGHSSA